MDILPLPEHVYSSEEITRAIRHKLKKEKAAKKKPEAQKLLTAKKFLNSKLVKRPC